MEKSEDRWFAYFPGMQSIEEDGTNKIKNKKCHLTPILYVLYMVDDMNRLEMQMIYHFGMVYYMATHNVSESIIEAIIDNEMQENSVYHLCVSPGVFLQRKGAYGSSNWKKIINEAEGVSKSKRA